MAYCTSFGGIRAADSEHRETPDHSVSKALCDSSSISDKYEDDEFSVEGDLSARKLESNPEEPPAALHQPPVWTQKGRGHSVVAIPHVLVTCETHGYSMPYPALR